MKIEDRFYKIGEYDESVDGIIESLFSGLDHLVKKQEIGYNPWTTEIKVKDQIFPVVTPLFEMIKKLEE